MKVIRRTGSMLADLSSDDKNHTTLSRGASQAVVGPGQEWEKEFNKYIMLDDDIPETVSTVQWWGVCTIHIFLIGSKRYADLNLCNDAAQCTSLPYMGLRLHAIISQLWQCRCQANGPSLVLASQLLSDEIG